MKLVSNYSLVSHLNADASHTKMILSAHASKCSDILTCHSFYLWIGMDRILEQSCTRCHDNQMTSLILPQLLWLPTSSPTSVQAAEGRQLDLLSLSKCLSHTKIQNMKIWKTVIRTLCRLTGLWVMLTPCSPAWINRCFGGTYCFPLQGRKVSQQKVHVYASCLLAGYILGLLCDLEGGGSSFPRKGQ
jgi:hypothetical protein